MKINNNRRYLFNLKREMSLLYKLFFMYKFMRINKRLISLFHYYLKVQQ